MHEWSLTVTPNLPRAEREAWLRAMCRSMLQFAHIPCQAHQQALRALPIMSSWALGQNNQQLKCSLLKKSSPAGELSAAHHE